MKEEADPLLPMREPSSMQRPLSLGVTLPFLVGERGDNRFFLLSSHRENGLMTEWLSLGQTFERGIVMYHFHTPVGQLL